MYTRKVKQKNNNSKKTFTANKSCINVKTQHNIYYAAATTK